MVLPMEEIFKDVPEYEGLYAVGDFGTIVRRECVTRNAVATWKSPERLIKPTLSRGYMVVNLWKNNSYDRFLVHRLVMLSFVGPSTLSVDHINGEKTDNRLVNLEYVTLRENTLRQIASGRIVNPKGEKNGKSKLKSDQIRVIREMVSNGLSSREIGLAFGVSLETISAIRSGRTWGHVI